ncbi:MAG: hypothetical protein CML20_02260 [Rheinheimera sp.]|nr:hypothetical protein [Rheinheimera sp.]
MRTLKITGWIILGLAATIAIALTVLLVAPKSYLGLLQAQLTAATGYQLNVDTLQVDLFPPRLAATNLNLSNPETPIGKNLLKVAQAELVIDVGNYFTSAPSWWRAAASGIELQLIDRDDGLTNWSTALPRSENQHSDSNKTNPGKTPAKPSDNASRNTRPALFSFSEVDIADLTYSRTIASPEKDDQSNQLTVSQLTLTKESDERLLVKLQASHEDQPLTGSGRLALPRSDQARDVDFYAAGFGAEIRLNGTVGSDGITPGGATVSVRLTEHDTLGSLINRDLGPIAPINLDGSLKAPQQGHWGLKLSGAVGGQPLQLSAKAVAGQPAFTLQNLSLDFADSSLQANGILNTTSHSLTGKITASNLALDQFPVVAGKNDGQKQSATDLTAILQRLAQWSIDLDLQAAQLHYQQHRAQNLNVNISSRNDAMDVTAELAGATIYQHPVSEGEDSNSPTPAWQLESPLNATMKLDFQQAEQPAGWPLVITLKTVGVDAELTTTFTQLSAEQPRATLVANIENFSAFSKIDTARWDSFLPLTLKIQLAGNNTLYQIDPFNISLGDSQLEGSLTVNNTQRLVAINGHFHAPEIDLNRFATTTAETLEGKGESVDEDSGDLISDSPLNWGWLSAATANVAMTIGSLQFNQTTFSNIKTQLVIRDSKLQAEPFDAELAQGKVRGHLNIEQLDKGASLDGRLMVSGLVPADLGQQNKGLIDGGETDLLLNLQANGNTPQQLASSLTGEIALEIQGATITNNLFEVLGSDILLQTINLLNPFAKRDSTTELECAAVYFKAKQGVLTSPEQLVIETSKMKIRGGGTINLNDESLRIDFVPTPRDGLGISLSNLASVVRLGGTLGKPQPVADPSGILKAGATIGAAIATGGLSLLGQGLFDRVRSAGTACGKIFDTVPETMNEQQN